ncbi:MAG: hypothetical protein H6558_08185 [Lewinellaceae bacterium]|nr:hypothetical protein [Lewinellaceae bacterium]
MKNILLITLAILGGWNAGFSSTPNPTALFFAVGLPAGTQVFLEIIEQADSEKMTVGRILRCRVAADVVVDGHIVIRTGAVATARVKKILPTTYNEAEQITIAAFSAKAADGQMIALNGVEQAIRGRMPNEPARIHIGTPLMGHVVNNYSIDAE